MTPEREKRIRQTCARRQRDLAVILENVHDPHNISAVLRSCDSVGVQSLYVVYTEPQLEEDRLVLGRKSSASAWKWVDVHYYRDLESCMRAVRQRCDTILATHLGRQARSLFETDLTRSTALMFGNERDGLSEAALAHADGQVMIPQMGMIRSLNISVACAVCLFEAFRQRLGLGYYTDNPTQSAEETETLVQQFIATHEASPRRKFIKHQ